MNSKVLTPHNGEKRQTETGLCLEPCIASASSVREEEKATGRGGKYFPAPNNDFISHGSVCVCERGGKRKRMTRVCVCVCFLFFVVSFQAESPLESLKGRERERESESEGGG